MHHVRFTRIPRTRASEGQFIVDGSRDEIIETWTLQVMLEVTGDIDFCKCDCESGEYALLLPSEDLQLRRIKRAILELYYSPQNEHEDVEARFRSAGFRVRASWSTAKSARMREAVRV